MGVAVGSSVGMAVAVAGGLAGGRAGGLAGGRNIAEAQRRYACSPVKALRLLGLSIT